MPRLYVIQVDIFEEATNYAYPVVTHLFYGKTIAEARRYHESHRKTDVFLRNCEDKDTFGKIRCRSQVTEGWTK